MFFFVWQSLLFWNQISYFKDPVYSSLIVEMKSERCLFLKLLLFFFIFFFEIQTSLVKDPTHVTQCSPSIVLYFENRNQPVVRLKWYFPWFFVSTLNSDFGYIFWWSVMRWYFCELQMTRCSGLIKKGCFFSQYLFYQHA